MKDKLLLLVTFLLLLAPQFSAVSGSDHLLRQTILTTGGIRISITTPLDRYRAQRAPGGGIKSPSIPLLIVIDNPTRQEWRCRSGKLLLDVVAQSSRRHETKAFRLGKKGMKIAAGKRAQKELEVGAFLTGIAAGYMKGDTLEVKAVMSCRSAGGEVGRIESNQVQISVFVPEG